jgi:hypothetical protein
VDPAGKEPDLLSLAAITDNPKPEVAAAGHGGDGSCPMAAREYLRWCRRGARGGPGSSARAVGGRTYARIWEGQVVELLDTDRDISTMFHPALLWIDVTDEEEMPELGALFANGVFSPALPLSISYPGGPVAPISSGG